jgi:hypothetical protein
MSWNLFAWLRKRVAESIIGGVSDALEALESGAEPPALALPEALSRRLLPALPSGEEGEEPANGKARKGRATT